MTRVCGECWRGGSAWESVWDFEPSQTRVLKINLGAFVICLIYRLAFASIFLEGIGLKPIVQKIPSWRGESRWHLPAGGKATGVCVVVVVVGELLFGPNGME
ncbi:hypothetical protein AVEN_106405-1 [Araneus ventricosus]|uniref:Uncharacterized protein n=1 Tax=Araneus ventricosus TaxID=182803 RepID=A0A4Y2ASU9_ARAVE|nr:hypothetical protein AVEN_106405-1 [Araneus ventricosus]